MNYRIRIVALFLLLVIVVQAYANKPLPPPDREWRRLRGGLRNSFIKFSKEKKGRVAFVGGSITQNPGWQNKVAAHLKKRFPETKFEFINAGLSSTGSTAAAFRLKTEAMHKGAVDLLFEEAAVNDCRLERTPAEKIRGMEGIVRHARELNPKIDIILLHFADPLHTADYARGVMPETISCHEKVAEHYNIPSINLALEVHDRMAAKQFDWEKDFVDLHPSKFGQNLYYMSIARLFDKTWSNPVSENEKMPDYPLPDMLDPQCYSKGKFADIQEAKKLDGFAIDPKCKPKCGGRFHRGFVNVPMLVGETVGASFEFAFTGRAVGMFIVAGPDAGTIEYSIDGGKKKELDLFARHSHKVNLPRAYVLDATLKPGKHSLKVTISEKANERSKGHALRIRNLLVNE